jgi:YidC/Oxa1 family membrane protein insertase
MFNAIAKPLASLLAFFYGLIPSYGVAIVLLTVAIMLLLTPLTVKSTRSMLAMQRLQPEIKRLQAQHKNDRQALNEAMMGFYKEHNVNPLGGCLPMLLQMPVFFGLYEAIRRLTDNPPPANVYDHGSKLFKSVCPHLNVVNGVQRCVDPEGSLHKITISLKSFGMDLAKSVSDSHGSFAKALPFYLLIGLTTATQYYQQRQLNNRNPSAAAANPQLQMTQKLFPIIFLFIYIRIPAAVVLYFLVSNLLRIGQQGAMWKWDPKLVAEVSNDKREIEDKTRSIEAKAKPVPNKGKAQAGKRGNGQAPADNGAAAKDAGKNTPPKGQGGKASPPAKSPPAPKAGGNGKDAAAGRPNVAKPDRSKPPSRQPRGHRGR